MPSVSPPFVSVSPPSVISGPSDPWVVEEVVWEEVVWEEMAAVGGCGREWRVSCVSFFCDTWSFSSLLSVLFCYVYHFCDEVVEFLFLLFCLFDCFWFCCVCLFLCVCLELFLFVVVFLG